LSKASKTLSARSKAIHRYTDPMQRAQTFLPDALGRVVEHVRLGDGTSAIRTTSQFDDAGAPDGRTKVTRADALGNLTITHQDFAGRRRPPRTRA
jgi:hypothetical protein